MVSSTFIINNYLYSVFNFAVFLWNKRNHK